MKLTDLQNYHDIVIQCHNNPDADALASGFALLRYFQSLGKKVRFVYGGTQRIQKSNLLLMVETLKIPVAHSGPLETPPELLLTVDCQYGEQNVQELTGPCPVAVIDHHKSRLECFPPLWEVRDGCGACATVVWDMLLDAGFDPAGDEALATALYYGLFMDTSKMQELRHPKDKDLRDAMEFCANKADLFHFQNCNLSLNELEIAGRAFGNYDFCQEYHFAVAEAERCDPNLLGVISDALMEVDVVNVCIAFCMLDNGAKLSVRSCVKDTRADELAAYVAQGLGSGGGHPQKSGGFLKESLALAACEERFGPLGAQEPGAAVRKLLNARLNDYFREREDIFHNGTGDVPDLSGEPLYQKRRLPIGYVRGTDLYPAGTEVCVRMLEGDFTLTLQEDTYFMIGVEAEVYKNDEAYFLSHNAPSDEPYRFHGEYAPTVSEAIRAAGETAAPSRRTLTRYAKTCIPKSGPKAHARQITRRTKIFVSWSPNYMLGVPGDWLVVREENPTDAYIVKKDIFEKTYSRCN